MTKENTIKHAATTSRRSANPPGSPPVAVTTRRTCEIPCVTMGMCSLQSCAVKPMGGVSGPLTRRHMALRFSLGLEHHVLDMSEVFNANKSTCSYFRDCMQDSRYCVVTVLKANLLAQYRSCRPDFFFLPLSLLSALVCWPQYRHSGPIPPLAHCCSEKA